MIIAFTLLSLFFMGSVYAGIRLQHNPPQNRQPWEPRSESRRLTEEQMYDSSIGYDEKLHSEFNDTGQFMTKGGWLRGIFFLSLVIAIVWLTFSRLEAPWYFRIILCVPCGGAAAMSLYNFLHRK